MRPLHAADAAGIVAQGFGRTALAGGLREPFGRSIDVRGRFGYRPATDMDTFYFYQGPA
jgi:hypothetical protein